MSVSSAVSPAAFYSAVAGVVAAAAAVLIFVLCTSRRKSLKGSHIMITGGSSGIGKSVAALAASEHSCSGVTLVARSRDKLDAARREVEEAAAKKGNPDCRVRVVSVDLSCGDEDAIREALEEPCRELGPVHVLVNCAGTSIAARFDELPQQEFRRMMEVNYFGSVSATRAVLPNMNKSSEKGGAGAVVFVSSQAGLVGLYGYSAYAASKFALRGLAEALSMELDPLGISVTVSFPPDTDTPGFEEEEKTKPEETRLLSQTAGLFSAADVARSIIDDALKGRFHSSPGTDGWMLTTLCAGMTDSSAGAAAAQAALMGIFRLVAFVYRRHFGRVVRRCREKKADAEKKRG